MRQRGSTREKLAGVTLVVLLSAGRVQVAALPWLQQGSYGASGPIGGGDMVRPVAPADSPKPAPVASPAAGVETAPVRRGTIAEVITLSGRVGGEDETALAFSVPTRV